MSRTYKVAYSSIICEVTLGGNHTIFTLLERVIYYKI
jgi:hypothetical protein